MRRMQSNHRRVSLSFAAPLITFVALACRAHERDEAASATTPRISYPAAPREQVVDTYHGVQVADPYRWLEDPDAPQSRAWIDAENALTRSYIEPVAARARIEKRLTELWNFERFGLPSKHGSRYFVTRNDGLQNQAVLYTLTALDGELRELVDPNKLSRDGSVALAGTVFSDDGGFVA